MISPAEAAWRFLPALALGCGLGVLFGFLRPLRHKLLPDLLFAAASLQCWVYWSFGVCQGDLRPAYTFAMLGSIFLWDMGPGRLLRPVFALFWRKIFQLWGFLLMPLKKFLQKLKKLRFSSLQAEKKRL